MTDYDKQSYLDDLKNISSYISTYVNAFESGRYTLVDEAADDNIDKRQFTIKHINEIVLAEANSILGKYK